MKLELLKGSTDVRLYIFIQDSSAATPEGLTGLLYNSAGLVCYYVRPGGTATQLPLVELATPAVTDPHLDGGFIEVDATNMPGVYRLDISDAILAAGVDSVVLMLHGAANMEPVPIEIQLIDEAPTNSSIADAVWDELLTGASHNIATSAGKRLRELASNILLSGTSPGGNTANTFILDAGADALTGLSDPLIIDIISGTGAGQSRQVFQYDSGTRTIWVHRDWKVTPDNTSEYVLKSSAGDTHVNEGVAQAGSALAITLNSEASAVDDTYNGQFVFLMSGTGQDQLRRVMDYNGTTKVATVDRAWDTNPDNTTVYSMLPSDDILTTLSQKEFDGVTFETLMQYLVALARGNMSVTGVGTDTLTITLYAQNGITPLVTFTQPATGSTAGSRTRTSL